MTAWVEAHHMLGRFCGPERRFMEETTGGPLVEHTLAFHFSIRIRIEFQNLRHAIGTKGLFTLFYSSTSDKVGATGPGLEVRGYGSSVHVFEGGCGYRRIFWRITFILSLLVGRTGTLLGAPWCSSFGAEEFRYLVTVTVPVAAAVPPGLIESLLLRKSSSPSGTGQASHLYVTSVRWCCAVQPVARKLLARPAELTD